MGKLIDDLDFYPLLPEPCSLCALLELPEALIEVALAIPFAEVACEDCVREFAPQLLPPAPVRPVPPPTPPVLTVISGEAA